MKRKSLSERRESIDERKAAKMAARNGGWMLKWSCPGWRGAPDRILFAGEGSVIFIEWKRSGSRRSRSQVVFGNMMARLGFPVYVVHSFEEFTTLCRNLNLPIYRKWRSGGLERIPAECSLSPLAKGKPRSAST